MRRIPSRPEGQEGGRVRVALETRDERRSRAYEWSSASTLHGYRLGFKARLMSNLTCTRRFIARPLADAFVAIGSVSA